MKVDIFMPLYLSDYDRDTADLSFEEHGFYMALLRNLWVRSGVIEMETGRLSRMLRTDVATFNRLWPAVSRFFQVVDGRMTQKRLTIELQRAHEKRVTAKENGAKGGRPKTQGKPNGKPKDNLSVNPGGNPGGNPEKTSSPSPSERSDPDLHIPPRDPTSTVYGPDGSGIRPPRDVIPKMGAGSQRPQDAVEWGMICARFGEEITAATQSNKAIAWNTFFPMHDRPPVEEIIAAVEAHQRPGGLFRPIGDQTPKKLENFIRDRAWVVPPPRSVAIADKTRGHAIGHAPAPPERQHKSTGRTRI